MFERFVNGPLFKYADLLFKIIFVNIMIVLLSLPVITLFPALVAGFAQIRFYLNENEGPLFKLFITEFRRNFLRNFYIGLIIYGVSYLLINNINFFYTGINYGFSYMAGLYVTLVFLFFFLLTIMHLPLACIYFPHLKTIPVIKISFYIGIKYIFTTILLGIPVSLTVILAVYSFPVFTFIGLGIPILIMIKITSQIYGRLIKKE